MENIITAILLLSLTAKSNNKELLVIVATGCILSEAMYQFINDVVLYYSIMAIITASLAHRALQSSECNCNVIYALIMLSQGTLCAVLVFSFSSILNELIEAAMDSVGSYVLLISAIVAIMGTDNLISRKLA